MLTGQELDKGMSMLKTIWSALALSLIMYVLAVPYLLRDTPIEFSPETYAGLRIIMYVLSFATLAASWLVRRTLLAARPSSRQNKSGQHPAVQRYTTAMIVALAMTEAIAIYGLILFLLGKNHTDLYLLTGFSAAGMTLYYPRREEVVSLAEQLARRA